MGTAPTRTGEDVPALVTPVGRCGDTPEVARVFPPAVSPPHGDTGTPGTVPAPHRGGRALCHLVPKPPLSPRASAVSPLCLGWAVRESRPCDVTSPRPQPGGSGLARSVPSRAGPAPPPAVFAVNSGHPRVAPARVPWPSASPWPGCHPRVPWPGKTAPVPPAGRVCHLQGRVCHLGGRVCHLLCPGGDKVPPPLCPCHPGGTGEQLEGGQEGPRTPKCAGRGQRRWQEGPSEVTELGFQFGVPV